MDPQSTLIWLFAFIPIAVRYSDLLTENALPLPDVNLKERKKDTVERDLELQDRIR
jgi:hypothetical protein